jgi:hypothetical protein
MVVVRQWRIGPDQCNRRCAEQYDAADGFDAEKRVERREGTLG